MYCGRRKRTAIKCFLLCITAVSLMSIITVWSSSGLYGNFCACQRCVKDSDSRFNKLINSSPQLVLSKTYQISQEDIHWWLRRQHQNQDLELFNQVLDSIFQIIPHVPEVAKPSSNPCRTCAVVGNSDNLLGSHYGPQIDKHDIIIRMNQGPTEGYEIDVGTRTTHRVMYPESYTPMKDTTKLLFISFKIEDLQWLLVVLKAQKDLPRWTQPIFNEDHVMILNPVFMKYVHEAWLEKKGKYPSTGFTSLVFSLQICDLVSIFGFGANKNGSWNHYYEKQKINHFRTGPHAGTHEYNVIKNLHKQQKITLFSPV